LAQWGVGVVFGSGTREVEGFVQLHFKVLKPGGYCISVSDGSIAFQREVLVLSYQCGKLVGQVFALCDSAHKIDRILVEHSEHGVVMIIRGGTSECLEALGMARNNAHHRIWFGGGFGGQDHNFRHRNQIQE
jgi:hypothetical protein